MDTYQTQAQAVTAKRRRAGHYPTKAQIKAGRKLINGGHMTQADWLLVSTHPYFSESQRSYYREQGESING